MTREPPRVQVDHRLTVAIAMRGDRLEALLRAYLAGPGREIFAIGDAGVAQSIIADHDHPASRAEMLQFVLRTGRPGIAIAAREPAQAGSVWVPKPVRFEALADAAGCVRSMVGSGPLVAAPALPRLLPASADGGAAVAPGARRRSLPGPYRTVGRGDWTGKVVWIACGVLGIAGLASALGWRPDTADRRQPPPPVSTSGDDAQAPRRAVQASLAGPQPPAPR